MNTPEIDVVPSPFVQPAETVTKFSYTVHNFIAFTSISISVMLFSSSGKLLDVQNIVMQGDDYAQWGNDDNYLIQFIASSVGLTLT